MYIHTYTHDRQLFLKISLYCNFNILIDGIGGDTICIVRGAVCGFRDGRVGKACQPSEGPKIMSAICLDIPYSTSPKTCMVYLTNRPFLAVTAGRRASYTFSLHGLLQQIWVIHSTLLLHTCRPCTPPRHPPTLPMKRVMNIFKCVGVDRTP